MSFSTLGLSAPLLQAVIDQQYSKPSPVQEQAIPALLRGKDVLGIARTGSGKTAGYVLPVLQLCQRRVEKKDRHVRVLVMVSTRELAVQVGEVFNIFSVHLPYKIKTMAVYGGVSINPQMMSLHGTDVLVATPGRLLDLIDSRAIHLSEIEILVLDEADKMLNLGFKEEMDKIFALLPSKRQNALFTATASDDIQDMQKHLLNRPVTIEIVEEEQDIDLIEQQAYNVTEARKGPLLRYLIKKEDMQQVLVFTSAVRTADNLTGKLIKNGIHAASLHGHLSQTARLETLQRFKEGKLRVLVASDLASRGIDIQQLPVVINYELPRSPKDYVHRIGRTGRAGASGKAISLICPEDQHHFGIIQKKMGKKVAILESDDINLQGF
ncbi:ATP-dependent RNA helicase RhlE [Filimonas lacunae]|uniref:ATP-dependent RNA helicase RhlE n=1 Tax=Filimonas lacunae TaxID=477680 RepID=A0A173M9X3_9BACT|nr:DEAD/DEAH box helicase [Filimonas lacunae]BAV04336.1 ATP-dependent RNA helicase RhlE [Filimonas lacunae]SIT31063.1 ATP-dependent RNA helicase RhlE [Filimonas lacunae]